jgi:hypothetical protein
MQAVSHPKEDVATSALAALTKIGSNAQQPLFLAALSDRRSVVKWYAMCAIEAHGDADAVDAVLARAQYISDGVASRGRLGIPSCPRP